MALDYYTKALSVSFLRFTHGPAIIVPVLDFEVQVVLAMSQSSDSMCVRDNAGKIKSEDVACTSKSDTGKIAPGGGTSVASTLWNYPPLMIAPLFLFQSPTRSPLRMEGQWKTPNGHHFVNTFGIVPPYMTFVVEPELVPLPTPPPEFMLPPFIREELLRYAEKERRRRLPLRPPPTSCTCKDSENEGRGQRDFG